MHTCRAQLIATLWGALRIGRGLRFVKLEGKRCTKRGSATACAALPLPSVSVDNVRSRPLLPSGAQVSSNEPRSGCLLVQTCGRL
eukprot:4875295-Amphidinium_carterae.1